MKKKTILISTILFFLSIFFININNVNALTFNTGAEDLWGGWDANGSTSITNSTAYTWSCKIVSNPNNIVIINNSKGCALSSNNAFTNSTAKIEITRISSSGAKQTVEKPLNIRANAKKVSIKVGETYDAGADFNSLGLKVYGSCSDFTVSPTSVLEKGSCGTYKFQTKALKAGTGTLQVKSVSGIKFRSIITVTDSQNSTTNYVLSINRDGGNLGSSDFVYSSDGGIGSYTYTKSTTDKSITVKLPTTGTKSGYTFGGIYTGANCSGTKMGSTATVSSSEKYKTFYACWKSETSINYVVSINRDGGNLGSSDFVYSSDGGIGSYTYSKKTTDKSITVKLPTTGTKSGYTFGGIYTGANCSGTKMGSTATVSSTEQYKTFYACWKSGGSNTNPTTKTPTTTKKATITTTVPKAQAPAVEIPVQKPIQTDFTNDSNPYRYVGDYDDVTLNGTIVSCGDVVKITTCDEDRSASATCSVSSVNDIKVTGTKVYRQKLVEAEPICPTTKRYARQGTTYYTNTTDANSDNKANAKTLSCNSELIMDKNPASACVYGKTHGNSVDGTAKQFCEVRYNNEVIYVDREQIGTGQAVCLENDKCVPKESLKDQTSFEEKSIPVCYTYTNGKPKVDGKNEKEIFTCAKGYRTIIREDAANSTCNKLKSANDSCYKTFIYSCISVARPKIHGTGSLATPEGIGTITIKGYDSTTNTGLKGYIINDGKKPTRSSEWKEYPNAAYETTETKTAGTHFVWTMTNDMSISYPIMLNIYSDDISTTVQNIEIKGPNDAVNFPYSGVKTDDTLGYTKGMTSSNYVRLSNHLMNDSTLASGFDMFQTAYELTVDSDQIALYATLTSADSRYVEGYEPRTVSLDYGRNIVLIKIINSSGKERTYTFIVTRTDNRESVNALKTLTTSVGSLNFDPYISDYTVSVPKNAKSVNINGTLESSNSAFIKGYEPRKVTLTNDITSAILKTISQAGITRNYVITFIKTGAEINEDISSSTYLSSLTIPGTEIEFNRETLSYTVAIEYEIETIPVFALPESENATVEINGNTGLKVGANKIEIIVTNDSQVKIYNVFINRKEDGLEVSSNTRLKTLTVKDYDLKFNEEINDYTIKIKREKTLLLTATPQSDRSEVYMYGNNDLNVFSTIRVKVIAENGDTGLYSVDIIKDVYNKKLETTIAIVGSIILLGGGIIIMIQKKRKSLKDYVEE